MANDQRRFNIGTKRSSARNAPALTSRGRGAAVSRVVVMGRDTLVTAADVARLIPSVSRSLVCVWRAQGKLPVADQRGRSPLYRWRDVLAVERDTRLSDPAHQRADAMVA